MRKIKLKSILSYFLSIVQLSCSRLSSLILPSCSECGIDDVLNFFGFSSNAQKKAFKKVCSLAGVPIFKKFDGSKAMKLVSLTQKQLVNRTDKQERWETEPLNWMNKETGVVLDSLKTLGFLNITLPQKQEYDMVCVLGARLSAMRERIKYLELLVKNGLKFKKIALLTGERYVVDGVDGASEELFDISKSLNIGINELTEAKLFKYLYEKSSLQGKSELILIDTLQKDGFRPTTKTTIDDFCVWQKNHLNIKNALFISNQPHVKYQKAIILEVLYTNKSDLDIEVVGQACKSENVQDIVGALGAYIWAYMPHCLRSMGFKIELKDEGLTKKLYGHQKWIYNSLPIE